MNNKFEEITPLTGVTSVHNVEFWDDDICPTCERIYEEIRNTDTCPECGGELVTKAWLDGDGEYIECDECGQEFDMDEEMEMVECDDHEKLIGDWKKNEDGLYEPDENGEFAAIVTSSTFSCVQVVWSKHTKRVRTFCSPCFPGQLDLDSGEGNYLAYDLPEDMKRKEDE